MTGGRSNRFELLGERSGRAIVVSIKCPSSEDQKLAAEPFRTIATEVKIGDRWPKQSFSVPRQIIIRYVWFRQKFQGIRHFLLELSYSFAEFGKSKSLSLPSLVSRELRKEAARTWAWLLVSCEDIPLVSVTGKLIPTHIASGGKRRYITAQGTTTRLIHGPSGSARNF